MGENKKIVVATSNKDKIREIMQIIDFDGFEFVSLSSLGNFPEPVEDGTTFEENARIKAKAAFLETGFASMADDSGIVVDALGGAPGIFSARYAGETCDNDANNAKLLSELGKTEDRSARFTCAIVFIDSDGSELTSTRSVEGKIAYELRGTNGFGYDPLFLPDEYGGKLTMAELSADQKNSISHRGQALREIKRLLLERYKAV